MKITIDIPDKRIQDLIITAFEGGINYWCKTLSHTGDPYFRAPFEDKGNIKIQTVDGRTELLSKERLEKGLKVMATKYPKHMADFLNNREDAITADVFIQCCLLNGIVYG